MPHRQKLLTLWENYTPKNRTEACELVMMKYFVKEHENCFTRENPTAHVTASAWVVNEDMTHVLLHTHKRENEWRQFGGHADGEEDVKQVATTEAHEETGLKSLKLAQEEPLDIGIRHVPEHTKNGQLIQEHAHLDTCYIFTADMQEPFAVDEGESTELKWIPLEEAEQHFAPDDTPCQRFLQNTLQLVTKRAA